MGIVSSAMFVVSGVYLALGLMYLRYWFDERSRKDYLAFSIACLGTMCFAIFERGMMTATSGADYLYYAYWSFYPGTVAVIAIAWFGYKSLHGSKWLFLTYAGLRILATILHMLMPNGINFRQVNGVGYNTFWGEPLSYPIAVANPWMVIPHAAHVLLIILLLEASFRCWRRGEYWQALTFGTGTILFSSTILVFAVTVLWGLASIPLVMAFAVGFIVAPMFYALNYDMHRAAMLSEELAQRDARLTETLEQLELSAAAGNVGMWIRSVDGEIIWASDKAGEIWGFSSGERFTQADLIQMLHPDDHERVMSCVRALASGKEDYRIEFRIVARDGEIRWIQSQGRIDKVEGKPIVRGALVDITRQKMAEDAIRHLSRKLITAQENERARVAFELHDDLNQNIALLSIQLGMLRKQPKDLGFVSDQLGQFVTDVERLSKDVHRISYELHPAKLTQLGVEAALRGFCREFSEKHGIAVDFVADHVPGDASKDIELCIYRITQESMQNVIKHSNAKTVSVSINCDGEEIVLTIVDDGKGFDINAVRPNGGLGLISIDERAKHVNGNAVIKSTPGKGTTVEVRIPVDQGSSLSLHS